ncbi:MAG: site-2 protease family protein [Desulfurococcales archaeon]|nr:site-2 protease family protein [Desulfurococcales archaeon]
MTSNNVILAVVSIIAFWLVVYILFKDKGGKRFQILPLAIIIRAGISLDPMKPSLKSQILRITGLIGLGVMVYLAFIFFKFIGGLFVNKYLGGSGSQVQGGVVPLIPGVTIPLDDLPYVLFGIGVAALVHELAHAYIARAEGLRIKDAGIAIFLFFPAAFVEPDEDHVVKAPLLSRLKLYSAGVLANAVVFFVLSSIMALLLPSIAFGVGIYQVEDNSPAELAGLERGFIIVEVNGVRVKTIGDLSRVFDEIGVTDPERSVSLELKVYHNGDYKIIRIDKPEGRNSIGIVVMQYYKPEALGVSLTSITMFNLILAIVNAAPLAIPLPGGLILSDGGHALKDVLDRLFGRKGVVLSNVASVAVFIMLLSLMTLTPIELKP